MNVEAAFKRIDWIMFSLAAVGTVAVTIRWGWRAGVAFAFGAAVAILNFRWLKSGVDALAAKFAVEPPPAAPGESTPLPPRPSAGLAAAKFMLRYALLGAAAYGIFYVLRGSVPAFLGGLFVSAAAIIVEMIYQLATA